MSGPLGTRRYRDRRHAGRVLAAHVRPHVAGTESIILGLPRGGVPVAYEIATALDVPLDVLVVRKLGVPGYGELAFGAIAEGADPVLNRPLIAMLAISPSEIAATIEREREELERRERTYRSGRPQADCAGRTTVLVDDGLATGATMSAAIEAVRSRGAECVVAAAPVGPRETLALLESLADAVVCPLVPAPLDGVGSWYDDFSQVPDAQIRNLLHEAAVARGA